MYKKHIFFLFVISSVITFVAFIPINRIYAETRYDGKVFNQNIVLTRSKGPFYFLGYSSIPKGVSVTVEKGTQVFIDGFITVSGSLIFEGEKDYPITIRNSSYFSQVWDSFSTVQKPITVIGGQLSIKFANIREMPSLVDAYSSSTVLIDNAYVEDVGLQNSTNIMNIFNNSVLDIKDSVFKNVISRVGIEVFNQSSILAEDSTFEGVGYKTSILIYDGNNSQSNATAQSTLNIERSFIKGKSESTVVSGLDRVQTQKGVEIFNKAYGKFDLVSFEDLTSEGISTFSNAFLQITNSVFTRNKIGIASYGSNIQITDSEIFNNTEHGAVIYGGEVSASDNWWGNETGPYSANLNPTGKGDHYSGTAIISPWKQSKPKKKIACCSNILFIPGIQGSRIYKKGLLAENQLWEPNTGSDVSKLFLNKDGYSIDKNLYYKDIIERTNIVFGGNDDIEIYRGFARALDGLHFNFSINDWQFAAYDWRMSPNTIVANGTRYSNGGPYKKMEDQIVQMSQSSKTGKVTLITHSYGGLVGKRFLTYMSQRGKIGLIDKVIFVAVPEKGSPSALVALLHGDNQDIGAGFIVNKNTMRRFAQNMPSIYALLPKVDSKLIHGVSATNTISVTVPDVNSVEDMYKFLFKEIARPSTDNFSEINIPLVSNKKIKQDIDLESGVDFIKPQSDSAYKNIEFYTILGVGLDTLESIRYIKSRCQSLGTHPWLMSANCGLDHEPINSSMGDGTVLATDIFQSLSRDNNLSVSGDAVRWGEKYIFNLGEYNRKNNKNYSHASIVSAPPVISTLMQIMLNNIGTYSLPAYFTKHGGIKMGGDTSFGDNNSSGGGNIENENLVLEKVYENNRYKVSASDIVFLSAKDTLGDVVGVNFSFMDLQNNPNSKTNNSLLDILPIRNTIPNSSFSHVGSSYYLNSESLPSNFYLRPDKNLFSTVQSADTSPDVDSLKMDFKIEEITPPKISDNLVDNEGNSTIIASFKNIPITEYSEIEVLVGGITNSASTTNSASASNQIKIEMKVTDEYDGIYSNVTTYTYTQGSSTDVGLGSGVSVTSGQPVFSSGDSSQGSNALVFGQIDEPEDILTLINFIRGEIQKSGVRANFKQRYLLKLSAIEKNYKLVTESKRRLARTYTRETSVSLASIIKDLNRTRSLYYRGGMTKAEAFFLYSLYSRLNRAFGS